MVHSLRGQQAAFLPVHGPQVRGWAGWPLHPSNPSAQSPEQGTEWRDHILPSRRLIPEPPAMCWRQRRTHAVLAVEIPGWQGGQTGCKKLTMGKQLSGLLVW